MIVAILFIVAAIVVASLRYRSTGTPSMPTDMHWVMWLSALCLLTASILSMPNPRACEGVDGLGNIKYVGWFLIAGKWFGMIALGLASLLMILTSAGGTPPSSSRFFMSIFSLLGAVLTLFTMLGHTSVSSMALLAVWLGNVALMFIRGLLGMFGLVPYSWRKEAWQEER